MYKLTSSRTRTRNHLVRKGTLNHLEHKEHTVSYKLVILKAFSYEIL